MESRYQRQLQLPEIGTAGQKQIAQASVLVVGAGGLGCPALQYLASSGVGCLGIIDPDTVEISNLARQILYNESDLQKNKALCARDKLKQLNPSIDIEAYSFALDHTNALSIIQKYDMVIDGSDNFSTRYLISDCCLLLHKPMIYGGLFKFEGQISVFNYQKGPSYRCLFPNPPDLGEVPNCSDTGILSVAPGLIGLYQATEALKIILKIGSPLSGALLVINLLTLKHVTFEFEKNPKEIKRVQKNKNPLPSSIQDCILDFEISLKDLTTKEVLHWIDVRKHEEKPRLKFPKLTEIPFEAWESLESFRGDFSKKILFCQSGKRSKSALSKMKEQGIQNCFYLKEGAEELKKWSENL
ncbi:HesA/MoeB/ThiF family protein [Flavobacteriaceae bacterium]|jgi:adenylyltransferase/sulfurtransferase|nr:HesA/MoeB/ThiF family protein [Flavobacteriaceae bacterium]MDA8644184.1 HesA/MoeB/ThiF family protein [Flavobacteriaceae bacterium]MDC0872016.1 HesA/MoeB/ThiF family protein [Flavobacteriaceae bacterium]